MSKIICDICGTTYQDTADCCPICGYAHSSGALEDLLADSPLLERGKNVQPAAAQPPKHKEIFDFDEVNPEADDEEAVYYGEPASQQGEHRPSVFLVILLVIIITLLLAAAGFLFFRFYLPNAIVEPPHTEATEETTATEDGQETTEPTIPCQSLALTSGVTELTREGQLWLLHVTVLPEDTTDPLIFYSEDESVVTVSEGGRLTAIGEGETNVFITCGEKEIRCRVVVRFQEETTPVETLPPETIPEDQDTTMPSQEATEPTTAPTEASQEVVLKLKQSDVSSDVRGVSFDLVLDCDLKPEDVTWLTLDSKVAIVRNGTVTTIGPGMTKIVAQYKGQQVECIVRCTFS